MRCLLLLPIVACATASIDSPIPSAEIPLERNCRTHSDGSWRFLVGVSSDRLDDRQLSPMDWFDLQASESRPFPNIGGTGWDCVATTRVEEGSPPAVGLRCEHDGALVSVIVACMDDDQSQGAFVGTTRGNGRRISARCYRRAR